MYYVLFIYGIDPFMFGSHVVFIFLSDGGMTACLALGSVLMQLTFCFIIVRSLHRTHHWAQFHEAV